jgi:hypothetical protein
LPSAAVTSTDQGRAENSSLLMPTSVARAAFGNIGQLADIGP